VICPPTIDFLVPGGYQTYKESFIGAIGTSAEYAIPICLSTIPKCSDIMEYRVVEENPAGSVYILEDRTAKFDVS
jgi:hypothetical protein